MSVCVCLSLPVPVPVPVPVAVPVAAPVAALTSVCVCVSNMFLWAEVGFGLLGTDQLGNKRGQSAKDWCRPSQAGICLCVYARLCVCAWVCIVCACT